ncbi:MAG: transcription antitermination factor NusB [Clostridia bacterium]|jgi:N utilization substance protein B|nr:transcription antitermination factor NusB [Clostridia bacterium]
MAQQSRKMQREAVFSLLFERDFRRDETPEEVFATWCEQNGEPEGNYVKDTFFGVCEKQDEIDATIERHSNGWKVARLTRVSRAVIRLCVYEMANAKDVPATVAINEAIELSKKYDDEKARSFVNGVLNGIKAEYDAK